MRKSRVNKLLVLAIVLLLVGLSFVSINFISPHTVLKRVSHQISSGKFMSVASINNSYINGNYFYPPFNPPNKDYLNLTSVYVNAGQIITVNWVTDTFVNCFVLSQSQFVNFQAILPSIENNTNLFSEWASKNGTNYEASATGKQDVWLSYTVAESGYYVVIIFVSQAYTSVQTFEEYLTTQTFQTQYVSVRIADDLYLFVGVAFICVGTPIFVYSLTKDTRRQKTAEPQ